MNTKKKLELPPVAECDVEDKDALVSFRALREKVCFMLDEDPLHGIRDQIVTLVSTDIGYKFIARIHETFQVESSLFNENIATLVHRGFVCTQVLGIRRLLEARKSKNPKDWVYSLNRVLAEFSEASVTREVYVCFDGTRYQSSSWSSDSEERHEAFDLLAGVKGSRRRSDLLRREYLDKFQFLLNGLRRKAKPVINFSHKVLAHASDSENRVERGKLDFDGKLLDEIYIGLIGIANLMATTLAVVPSMTFNPIWLGFAQNMHLPMIPDLTRFDVQKTKDELDSEYANLERNADDHYSLRKVLAVTGGQDRD